MVVRGEHSGRCVKLLASCPEGYYLTNRMYPSIVLEEYIIRIDNYKEDETKSSKNDVTKNDKFL